jgi:hypothetical protein
MPYSQADLEAGLAAFSALLIEEYGRPIAHWAGPARWGDGETAQISGALEILIKQPIAEARPLPTDGAGEQSAALRWTLSDAKIADPAFEASWQWRLLAALDNASRSEQGGMLIPSDPRLFLLRIRYEHEFLAPLAEYFLKFLCGRSAFPTIEDDASRARVIAGLLPELSLAQAEHLQKLPGFEDASPAFVAGTLFMIAQMGTRAFCDWCDERC